jgi:hypothetical protein
MNKTLRDLRKFILIKCSEGAHSDVRSFIIDNLDSLALAFKVSAETIMTAVVNVPDDTVLASRMVETVQAAERKLKTEKRRGRAQAAQESANILASAVEWFGDRAYLDLPSIFASVLTRRDDLLSFTCDTFSVSVYMGPLLDLSRIARTRVDLTGYVDAEGLHLRWVSGGLNLRPQEDRDAQHIVMALRARATPIAA